MHEQELLGPVIRWERGMYTVIAALGTIFAFGTYAYFTQLCGRLAVTGMRDTVS